jgi:hypothetical protein
MIRKLPPIHFLLLGVAPVLTLFANNIDQVPGSHLIRSLLVATILAIFVFAISLLVFRDRHSAALAASVSLLLFYSYGHVYGILKAIEISGNVLGRHRYLFPLWIVLFVAALWVIGKRIGKMSSMTPPFNLISLLALAFPLYQMAAFGIRVRTDPLVTSIALSNGICRSDPAEYPDIYYIILDEYPRSDVLLESFDYDNSGFIESLSSMGFYVASQSQSNYSQTELSLASSMNLNYLDALSEEFHSGSDDRSGLWHLIRNSQVRQLLEDHGYRTVAFESGYMWTEIRDADPFIARNRAAMNALQISQGFNPFESMLFRTTAGIVITDGAVVLPESFMPDIDAPFQDHRERILFALDKLEEMPSLARPKFVFAHLVTPHMPFVFGPNGEYVENEGPFTLLDHVGTMDRELYISRFTDQLTYVNHRIEGLVAKLIENVEDPLIVVIQADHGPAGLTPNSRVAILNAYYLPEAEREELYPTISPVNTFRVVLNSALGCDLELLPDKSHFSSYQDPYAYQIIPTPQADLSDQ